MGGPIAAERERSVVEQEVLRFLVAALLSGAVIFGGTTLGYFLSQRPQPTDDRVGHRATLPPHAESDHDDERTGRAP